MTAKGIEPERAEPLFEQIRRALASTASRRATRRALPSGAMPMGATYNFTMPASQAQVGITTMTQDQMFQTTMENFPNMMQQMGAKIESNNPWDVRGRQGQLVVTTLKDPQSEMVMRSLNVFVPGPNVWVQVTGPTQSASQLETSLEILLKSIQF
jgi:hypothetical protein